MPKWKDKNILSSLAHYIWPFSTTELQTVDQRVLWPSDDHSHALTYDRSSCIFIATKRHKVKWLREENHNLNYKPAVSVYFTHPALKHRTFFATPNILHSPTKWPTLNCTVLSSELCMPEVFDVCIDYEMTSLLPKLRWNRSRFWQWNSSQLINWFLIDSVVLAMTFNSQGWLWKLNVKFICFKNK